MIRAGHFATRIADGADIVQTALTTDTVDETKSLCLHHSMINSGQN